MLFQDFYDDEEEAQYRMHLARFSYNEAINMMNPTGITDKHEKVQCLLLWSEALNCGKGPGQTNKNLFPLQNK